MNKEFKIGLWMVISPLILTMIIPFWISDPDDVSRYAAGGQVFGALATFFTLIYILLDNLKRNQDEEDRKNREIITLWQANMPYIIVDFFTETTKLQDNSTAFGEWYTEKSLTISNISKSIAYNLSYTLSSFDGSIVTSDESAHETVLPEDKLKHQRYLDTFGLNKKLESFLPDNLFKHEPGDTEGISKEMDIKLTIYYYPIPKIAINVKNLEKHRLQRSYKVKIKGFHKFHMGGRISRTFESCEIV